MTIKLDNVSAHYNKKLCLQDITLTIEPGQTWAILGSNGSGKSALGRLFCKQLQPTTGSTTVPEKACFVSFESVTEALEQERYNDDSDILGGADQGTSTHDFILGGNTTDEVHLSELAQQLNFVHILERGIKFLSTGEMRKALICRALLQHPTHIVLDEPFDGLDHNSKESLQALIKDIISHGINVTLLLNRFSEILPEVTSLAYMQQGKVILAGAKKSVLASTTLNRLISLQTSIPGSLPEMIYPQKHRDEGISPIIMEDINVSYVGKPVLTQLNWEVKAGEHWIIAGPNGSGKTTLLNLISGENTQAYANKVKLFGQQKGSGESVWDIKKRIGIISTAFQRNYRVSGTTLSVVVSGFYDSVGVYRKVSKAEKLIALEWLELLKLSDLAHKQYQKLSFGEQRLVLLARAMIKHPEVLILDEPCQGLDDINREMILRVINILASKGNTQILYVTHAPEDRIEGINNHLQLVPSESGGFTGRITKS